MRDILKVTIFITVLILLGVISNNISNKAVNECISNGNTKAFCEYQLNR